MSRPSKRKPKFNDLSAAELKFLQKLMLAEMNYEMKKYLRGKQSAEDFREFLRGKREDAKEAESDGKS